ncbi:hypothetical protein J437_LFUL017072, partial [Ladona fulva]
MIAIMTVSLKGAQFVAECFVIATALELMFTFVISLYESLLHCQFFKPYSIYGLNSGIISTKIQQFPENLKCMPACITDTAVTGSPSTSAGISSPEMDQCHPLHKGIVMKKLQCPHCLSEFSNNGNLKVHIRDQHVSWSQFWHCLQCNVTYKNRSSLRTHLWRAHQMKLCD